MDNQMGTEVADRERKWFHIVPPLRSPLSKSLWSAKPNERIFAQKSAMTILKPGFSICHANTGQLFYKKLRQLHVSSQPPIMVYLEGCVTNEMVCTVLTALSFNTYVSIQEETEEVLNLGVELSQATVKRLQLRISVQRSNQSANCYWYLNNVIDESV